MTKKDAETLEMAVAEVLKVMCDAYDPITSAQVWMYADGKYGWTVTEEPPAIQHGTMPVHDVAATDWSKVAHGLVSDIKIAASSIVGHVEGREVQLDPTIGGGFQFLKGGGVKWEDDDGLTTEGEVAIEAMARAAFEYLVPILGIEDQIHVKDIWREAIRRALSAASSEYGESEPEGAYQDAQLPPNPKPERVRKVAAGGMGFGSGSDRS